MRGTTPEFGMLADVIESHSAISGAYRNVWLGPYNMSLRHSLT